MEGMSKLEVLKLGDYEAKPYQKLKSLGQVREIFHTRTYMVEGFRANYKNRYNGKSLNCAKRLMTRRAIEWYVQHMKISGMV